MNKNDLGLLKNKIISELKELFPDIYVHINPSYTQVNRVHSTTTSGERYYPYGQRAYIGMTEACISVYWDKFYDRICGNGWMYGKDVLFKFDIKDGDCKYCNTPTFIEDYINTWIDNVKKEQLDLDLNWKALAD